jgi:hypothetical protein
MRNRLPYSIIVTTTICVILFLMTVVSAQLGATSTYFREQSDAGFSGPDRNAGGDTLVVDRVGITDRT